MKFTVRTEKRQYKRIPFRQLKAWADSGRITPNDLVRPNGRGRWYRADAINGLFDQGRVSPVAPPPLPGPAKAPPQTSERHPSTPRKDPIRTLLVVALFLALCATPFYPIAAFASAAFLVIIVSCTITPPTRPIARRIFHLVPGQFLANTLKVSMVCIYAIVFVFAGYGGTILQRELEASRQREAAAAALKQERVQAANERAQELLATALKQIDQGELEQAADTLRTILSIPDSSTKQEPARLVTGIQRINSPEYLMERLISLSDAEFVQISDGAALPTSMTTGHDKLDETLFSKAREVAGRAAIERDERKRRAIAEEQERLRAAEQARIEQEQAKEARRAAASQELTKTRDEFAAILDALNAEVGLQLFEGLTVERIGDHSWRATVTVSDLWHIRHKQVRLQDAQALWAAWAIVASPAEPDRAFLKLVDYNGNSVGGSSWLAGSVVSVPE